MSHKPHDDPFAQGSGGAILITPEHREALAQIDRLTAELREAKRQTELADAVRADAEAELREKDEMVNNLRGFLRLQTAATEQQRERAEISEEAHNLSCRVSASESRRAIAAEAELEGVRAERDRPNLGLATTRQLLDELRTRIEVDYFAGGGGLDYTTVNGRPDGSLDDAIPIHPDVCRHLVLGCPLCATPEGEETP